jgi:quercetin dioxygenase-like cupin family protein
MVYEQIDITQNSFKRVFSENSDNTELVWHRDLRNRWVEVIEGGDWKFQTEDELPITLVTGMNIFIPKEVYHRVITGSGKLIVLITEETENGRSNESETSAKKSDNL